MYVEVGDCLRSLLDEKERLPGMVSARAIEENHSCRNWRKRPLNTDGYRMKLVYLLRDSDSLNVLAWWA